MPRFADTQKHDFTVQLAADAVMARRHYNRHFLRFVPHDGGPSSWSCLDPCTVIDGRMPIREHRWIRNLSIREHRWIRNFALTSSPIASLLTSAPMREFAGGEEKCDDTGTCDAAECL